MNRSFKVLFFAGAILLALTGCRNVQAEKETDLKIQAVNADEESIFQQKCQSIGDNMLKSLKDKNRDAFVADMIPELSEKFTDKVFEDFCGSLQKTQGDIVSWTYVTDNKRPPFLSLFWKLNVEKKREDGSVLQYEALFNVVFGKVDENCKIMGFSIL